MKPKKYVYKQEVDKSTQHYKKFMKKGCLKSYSPAKCSITAMIEQISWFVFFYWLT